jgi:hypothetical protein
MRPIEDCDRGTFPPEQPGGGAPDTRCAPGNDDLASLDGDREPVYRGLQPAATGVNRDDETAEFQDV